MAEATRNVQELDSLLRNGVHSINMLGAEEFIVLVGCTGSGKSTFLKFLLKDPTLQIAMNSQEDCIFIDGESTIGSEDCLTSKTLMPNLRIDEETGIVVLDCAGFEDTRSEENDLIASFLNKTVLDKAKKIKLVVVESYDKLKLNADRNAFMNVLSHVSGLLKYNHTSFTNSICFVATKIFEPFKSDEALIRFVKTFFEHAIKSLEEKYGAQPDSEEKLREMEILRFLIANSQIGIFRRPNEVADDPWSLPALQENFKNLRKLLFEDVEYTPDNCGEFNIVVSPKTKLWIRGPMIKNTFADLKTLISSLANTIEQSIDAKLGEIPGEVEEKLKKTAELGELTVAKLSSIKSLQGLENFVVNEAGVQEETMEEFKFQADKVMFFFGVAERDEGEIKELIIGLNGKRDAIIAKIKQLVEVNNFILDLAKDSESCEVRLVNDKCMELFNDLNCAKFQLKMTNLLGLGFNERISLQALNLRQISESQITDLKALFQKKNENHFSAEWTKNGNCLLVLGRFVFLSQVLKEINLANRQENVKQVVVAATQHLYIDCDLNLQHTHLALMAPRIESIREKRIIFLRGEDAPESHDGDEQVAYPASEDYPGRDGIDGNPGFSSGSFTLIALDIINPSLLEVKSNGGNGSDGQDGGDGRDAPECPFPSFEQRRLEIESQEDLLAHIANDFEASGYTVEIFHSNQSSHYFILVGMKSADFDMKLTKHSEIKPTDGGRGGNGGSLAVEGDLNLRVENSAALEKVSINCSKGVNGTPGNGGMAGSNARGKFRKYKCKLSNIFTLFGGANTWTISSKEVLEEGECNSKFDDADDGECGEINESCRPHYKYPLTELLSIEDIVNSLNDYAIKIKFNQEPNFLIFNNFLTAE
ncbi:uncharacterized protein LOC135947849 [Cloeon dipterum]|uniref:uncharacterized protein LOC135947849 n=1 Tax=Cloeon dipterum TaxID=197152 RepID=UPI0032205973